MKLKIPRSCGYFVAAPPGRPAHRQGGLRGPAGAARFAGWRRPRSVSEPRKFARFSELRNDSRECDSKR